MKENWKKRGCAAHVTEKKILDKRHILFQYEQYKTLLGRYLLTLPEMIKDFPLKNDEEKLCIP